MQLIQVRELMHSRRSGAHLYSWYMCSELVFLCYKNATKNEQVLQHSLDASASHKLCAYVLKDGIYVCLMEPSNLQQSASQLAQEQPCSCDLALQRQSIRFSQLPVAK